MPHAHMHGEAATGHRLGLAVVLTLAFVLGEPVAGWFANSLALLSDAAHNFADALALLFSWYALRVGRRPADPRRTFGYHRVGILAALVNAASLIILGVHDPHVWMVASGMVACSCHIVVAEQSVRSGRQVLRAHDLEHHFGLAHTTVQVEVEGCELDDMDCTMRRAGGHAHHHHGHAGGF